MAEHKPPARLPKYRHYRPKDLAVVRIDGRDHYLGRYDSTASKEKYRRLIAAWMAGVPVEVRASPGSDGPSIAEVMVAYLKWADGYYLKDGEPTSEPTCIRGALRPLRKLYSLTPARDFGPRALKLVRQAMIDDGLCRNEVNKRTRHVVRLFKWAASEELLPASVHEALKTVRGLAKGRSAARESEPVRPVPSAMVEAIRLGVSRQVWAMIELQILTGMRPGEVCMMRSMDLDTSGPVWIYTPGSHKTEHHGKSRSIFVGPRAQEVLRPWLRVELGAFLFQPAEAEAERHAGRRKARQSPMTPSQESRKPKRRPRRAPGQRYRVSSYAHAIAAGCRKAFPHPELSAIPPKKRTPDQVEELKAWHREHSWHPHQLRHSAATSLRREFGLDAARVILGHSSATTAEIYAEADLEKARSIMGRIG